MTPDPMPTITIVVGSLLTVLGVGAYLGTGAASVTALIPAFLGLPLVLLGVLGRAEARRKVTMHVAVVLAALGFLGSLGGVGGMIDLLRGETVERPTAVVVQSLVVVITAIYLVLAVRSFVRARRGGVA